MGRRRLAKLDLATAIPCTREQAAYRGERHYFTGRPCDNGHLAYRYVSNASCLECRKPPPLSAPYMGFGYAHLLMVRLKLRALPPLHHMDAFMNYMEDCAQIWLEKVGVTPKLPRDEDGVIKL